MPMGGSKGPRRIPRISRRPEPDAKWNETPPDTAEALAQCTRIKKKIEDAPSHIADKAYAFFEDIDRKATEIAQTIQSLKRVSPAQKKALDAWEGGVDKWLDNDNDKDEDFE